jgi:hypothetical protein
MCCMFLLIRNVHTELKMRGYCICTVCYMLGDVYIYIYIYMCVCFFLSGPGVLILYRLFLA